jgi:hypothetical protein
MQDKSFSLSKESASLSRSLEDKLSFTGLQETAFGAITE